MRFALTKRRSQVFLIPVLLHSQIMIVFRLVMSALIRHGASRHLTSPISFRVIMAAHRRRVSPRPLISIVLPLRDPIVLSSVVVLRTECCTRIVLKEVVHLLLVIPLVHPAIPTDWSHLHRIVHFLRSGYWLLGLTVLVLVFVDNKVAAIATSLC